MMLKLKTIKMENKYFIPKIEDIRVGYECEIQVYGEDRWLKTIFSTLAIF